MNFGQAFEQVKQGKGMRLPQWQPDVLICAQYPDEHSKMTAPYLYVESRFGRVPWKETNIELFSEDWEVVGESEEIEYEMKDLQLTLETLQTHAEHCLANNLSLSVLIDMPGFDEPELITNPPSNIAKKMDYYRETYDENCNHKHATGIRIIAYAL